MVFSSIPFLYCFLPIVLICYFLVKDKHKNTILFLSSVLFYAWGEPRNVFLMLISTWCTYFFGILIEKQKEKRRAKQLCILSVLVSLVFLIYFKYIDFFIENINALTGAHIRLLRVALPIGISFYTFQLISYTVDVYRGEKAQKKFISLAAYITMFPQLVAGPIVRYKDIKKELETRNHSVSMEAEGIRFFMIGLAKKVLLANQLGQFVSLFQKSDEKSILFYWMYAAAFSLQIYFDFSGYSDMAIGLGKVFGFHLMENFHYPFMAKSMTDFWRRWHISLGSWFRDYVYIPMGGNRVKKARWFFNLTVVWFLTGFWHGAAWNFILWGMYFAILLILEKAFYLDALKKSRILSRFYTLPLLMISFVIFNASSLKGAVAQIGSLFGAGGLPFLSSETIYYLRSYGGIFLISIIAATPLGKNLWNKWALRKEKWMNLAEIILIVFALILITAFLVDGSFNPFLYFRF